MTTLLHERVLRTFLIAFILTAAGCASAPQKTECPDSTHVLGSECHLAPDGSYYGDGAEIPEDAADDTADVADEQVDDESGMVPVEVIEIDVGGD